MPLGNRSNGPNNRRIMSELLFLIIHSLQFIDTLLFFCFNLVNKTEGELLEIARVTRL